MIALFLYSNVINYLFIALSTATATATVEKSEDEFDYATSDLEESSILDDSEFADEDFEIGDGDEL